ncbi:Fe-S cluster assembly ATPase SufC [bacterium]|jgi:Fe-S cluster assembly ATP-binding protein|nr:Fe-S cluster assembly ATPase SufC [bacterium]
MLEIKNLHAKIVEENLPILKGVNLTIKAGETHAIMGPNGSGKSTLSKVLAGDPAYEITAGEIILDGKPIQEESETDRALMGLFMAFQYPVEVPGVNNGSFLRMAYNAQRKFREEEEVDPLEFQTVLEKKLNLVGMDESFLDRDLNFGFSGGEKKRNEILQMAVLDPKVAILDETDSGLDVDALKSVGEVVSALKRPDNAFLVITHYQRLLNYIVPDVVHAMVDGRIVQTGDKSLALTLDEHGYETVGTAS